MSYGIPIWAFLCALLIEIMLCYWMFTWLERRKIYSEERDELNRRPMPEAIPTKLETIARYSQGMAERMPRLRPPRDTPPHDPNRCDHCAPLIRELRDMYGRYDALRECLNQTSQPTT